MLGYEQAIAEAADLEARALDVALDTPELYAGNDYYGMAAVLKEYSGLSPRTALRALLPHGVYLNDHLVARLERRCGLPAVLAFPSYRVPLYRRLTPMAAIPSAAAFLYALRLVEAEAAPARRGTIFFPVHSTRFITADSDFDLIAEKASALSDTGPVTVCLYFQDLQFGRGEPFIRRGLEVVSAGHINDPRFLFRLAHLLRGHERAVGTALGSQAFYAEAAGCPFRLLPVEHEYVGKGARVERDAPTLTPNRAQEVRRIERLYESDVESSSPEKRAVAERYLGAEHLLDGPELAELLRWCEKLDRRGRLFTSNAPAESAVIPAVIRRPVIALTDGAAARLRRVRARALGFVPRAAKDAVRRGLGGRPG